MHTSTGMHSFSQKSGAMDSCKEERVATGVVVGHDHSLSILVRYALAEETDTECCFIDYSSIPETTIKLSDLHSSPAATNPAHLLPAAKNGRACRRVLQRWAGVRVHILENYIHLLYETPVYMHGIDI